MKAKISYGPTPAVCASVARDGSITYAVVDGIRRPQTPNGVAYEASYESRSGLSGEGVLYAPGHVLVPLGTARTDTSRVREQWWVSSPWEGWEWAALTTNQQSGPWGGVVAVRRESGDHSDLWIGHVPVHLSHGPESADRWRDLEWLPDGAGDAVYGGGSPDTLRLCVQHVRPGVSAWDLVTPCGWRARPAEDRRAEALGLMRPVYAGYDLPGYCSASGAPGRKRPTALLGEDLDADLPGWVWDAELGVHYRGTRFGWDVVTREGLKLYAPVAGWAELAASLAEGARDPGADLSSANFEGTLSTD